MGKRKSGGLLIILILSASFSWAEDGVTEKEIRIGMSNGQTGPTAENGLMMKQGVTVYFNKTNSGGGVQGRTENRVKSTFLPFSKPA